VKRCGLGGFLIGAILSDGALNKQSPAVWLGGPWFPPPGVISARLSCTDTCDFGDFCYANVDQMGIVEAPTTY